MAQIISVRLNKPDHQPIGFRLQGGKDFGTPLVVQKVNGGSAAERAGLLAGDAVIQVNGSDVYNLRHQDAQDAIRHAGLNLEITVQRGGGTWRPSVTPTGSLPRPGKPLGAVSPVTQTSLKAPQQTSLAFGSGHNSVAKPFNYMNGSGDSSVKSIVNKQYNTPVGMYSDETIAETLSAQTEVLAGGVLGVNFKKNEKTYDAEKSAVFKMLQEDSNDPEPESAQSPNSGPASGLRHVTAPVTKPDAPINNTGGLPPGQNICEECERLIIGVFVRIKDKNLHVECFKCATCGTSLKNQGYYNLNGKLYCDIHAKLVARQNPPASNLEPVTILPGGKFPSGTYSTPLSSHTTPLPPLSTNYNTNGNSLFSQSNETKSFGDSVDPTPELKQQNVEAFTSLLHNGHESDNKNLSATGNGLLNISGKENSLDYSVNEASPITSAFSTNSIVNSNTNSAYRKVLPPHMGGNYKPASNLSGPKPFGSSTFSGASPSLSPRSAPISPASTLPRAAPVAPVVPPPSQTTLQFTDKKTENGLSNTNTDTLIRKMAKFALSNDYEIGIQRKIKPRDHIQNMADKIKETVVMKHPLNTPPDYTQELNNSKLVGSPFNSRQGSPDDKTLRRQMKPSTKLMYNNFEIGVQRKIKPGDHISSMADKIKETIVSKHPTNSFMNEYKSPSTTASSSTVSSAHSREGSLDSSDSSHSSHYLRNGKNGFGEPILPPPPPPPPTNGFKNEFKSTPTKEISSTKDSNKIFDYTSPYDNHKSDILKSSPLVNKVMNDLKIDNQCSEKFNDKIDNDIKKSVYSNQNYNNIMNKRNDILNGSNKEKICFESRSTTNSSSESLNDNKKRFLKKTECTEKIEDKSPVKLREKKRDTSNDENSGKRDSHVITRPISTIASFDLVDGTYPICNHCNKQITRGPFITALGRIWCPDHFVCVNQNCRRPLQDIGFVEENGQLYCEYCFEQFIAPACDKCHAKIKGDCLNAIGKHFHPECFNCAYCGKLFGNNPFFLEDGLPYCEADWNELFTTKCFACGFPVEAGDRWVEALNNNYHSQCFNCTMCKKNLEGQSFFAKGGRPFCKNHAR